MENPPQATHDEDLRTRYEAWAPGSNSPSVSEAKNRPVDYDAEVESISSRIRAIVGIDESFTPGGEDEEKERWRHFAIISEINKFSRQAAEFGEGRFNLVLDSIRETRDELAELCGTFNGVTSLHYDRKESDRRVIKEILFQKNNKFPKELFEQESDGEDFTAGALEQHRARAVNELGSLLLLQRESGVDTSWLQWGFVGLYNQVDQLANNGQHEEAQVLRAQIDGIKSDIVNGVLEYESLHNSPAADAVGRLATVAFETMAPIQLENPNHIFY